MPRECGSTTRQCMQRTSLVTVLLVTSCGVGYDVREHATTVGSGGRQSQAGSAGAPGGSSSIPSDGPASGGHTNSVGGWTAEGGIASDFAGNGGLSLGSAGAGSAIGQAGTNHVGTEVSMAGAGGAASSAPIYIGGSGGTPSTESTMSCGIEIDHSNSRLRRKMLLRDGVRNRIAFIDVQSAPNSWYVDLERTGHDLQLVGNCQVMVGTDTGYAVYDLRPPHQKTAEVASFPGTVAARRLRNKNTLLVGVGQGTVPYQGSDGVVLVELDGAGTVVNKIVVSGTYYVRLVRETSAGTYLIANNTRIIEVDRVGNPVTANLTLSTQASTHAWKALRVTTSVAGVNETIVSTGNLASLLFFDSSGNLVRRITGGTASIPQAATAVNPQYYSDFQVLRSGNLIVANSYETGSQFTDCIPILEYTPDGALAWYWGDPTYAAELSAIQGLIVLDGLDLTKLHVEDSSGQQVPTAE